MPEQRGEFDPIAHWDSVTEANRDKDPFLEEFEIERPLEANRGRAIFELPEGIEPKDVAIMYGGSIWQKEVEKNEGGGARISNGMDVLEVKFRNRKVYIRGRKNSEVRFILARSQFSNNEWNAGRSKTRVKRSTGKNTSLIFLKNRLKNDSF